MRYAFIREHQGVHRISLLCRMMRVSRSGYYEWLGRGPSERARTDARLLGEIRRVHARHRGHSGGVKTWRVLRGEGIEGGKHRIARIRREHGIVAKRRRRFVATTRSRVGSTMAPNRLQRCFTAEQPNRVWVGDVTFIPTREGWLYLAVLLDLYSRRVVGWSMSERNDTPLVSAALEMALARRQPTPGLIHHTDRGQTYVASSYRERLAQQGIESSMSRTGDCWDNAVAESFFATLEFELIEQQVFVTRDRARSAIFEFIEVFYNRQRAHQALDYRTPVQVEQEGQLVA